MNDADARRILGMGDHLKNNAIANMFEEADTDSDGLLNFEEMFRYWVSRHSDADIASEYDDHRPTDWPKNGAELLEELKTASPDKEDALLVAALAQAKYDVGAALSVLTSRASGM